MFILTEWCGDDLKDGEHYILLVSNDGNFKEVKVRCLCNFPNSTIVGHLEYDEDFLVYTFFATENLPIDRFTVLRKDVEHYNDKNYCKSKIEVESNYLTKLALIRAKDIRFKL